MGQLGPLKSVPATESGDDAVEIGAPDEGLGLGLGILGDESVDGVLQIDNAREDAVFQSLARELGNEALDSFEQRINRRTEVEGSPRVPSKPSPGLGCLVR